MKSNTKQQRKDNIFVSCIDDLLGTDHDALIDELSGLYPRIRFVFCHMNPTSTDTGVPPAVNIQNKNYSLLDVTKEKDAGVNFIGNLAPLRSNGEVFQMLLDMGVTSVRQISDYDTFAGYQEMAKSSLNLIVTPTGKYASLQMEKKHGIPYEMVLTSFQTDCIRENYEKIAEKLGVKCPDVSAYEKEAEETLKETAAALNGMPVIIDGEAIVRPFDLAKAEVNLVVTESGLQAAKLLRTKFDIPYVVGMPIGNDEEVKEALEATLQDKKNRVLQNEGIEGDILIVGEQVLSNSIRAAILKRNPKAKVQVGSMFGLNSDIAGMGDLDIPGEETLVEFLASGKYKVLIGDPLMEDLLEEDSKVRMVKLPHVALSSKLHWNDAVHFLREEMEQLVEEAIQR